MVSYKKNDLVLNTYLKLIPLYNVLNIYLTKVLKEKIF